MKEGTRRGKEESKKGHGKGLFTQIKPVLERELICSELGGPRRCGVGGACVAATAFWRKTPPPRSHGGGADGGEHLLVCSD